MRIILYYQKQPEVSFQTFLVIEISEEYASLHLFFFNWKVCPDSLCCIKHEH